MAVKIGLAYFRNKPKVSISSRSKGYRLIKFLFSDEKIKISTFNFKLIRMRLAVFTEGYCTRPTFSIATVVLVAFRMRILFNNLSYSLRRHFHSTEPLFEFPRTSAFGIIRKPNKTISMMWNFSFFL
jgi:hypothetical protein